MPLDGFARSVAVLAGGSAAAQVVAFAVSPVLTRLYTPEQIGAFSVYLSVILIALPISTLSYEVAIPLPESREDGVSLLLVALTSGFVASGILGVMSLLAVDRFSSEFGLADLKSAVWIFPLGLIVASTLQVLTFWSIREGDFASIARSRLAQSSSSAATQVLAGLLASGTLGLALGDILGRLFGSLVLGFRSLGKTTVDWTQVNFTRVRLVAVRYRRFPLFQSWGGTLNTVTSHMPVVIVTVYYGLPMAGQFALAVRVLQAPALLLGSAFAQAYINRAADLARDDPSHLLETFDRLARRLFLIGFLPATVLGVFSAVLFPALFGPSWEAAGRFGQLLAPMLLALLTVSPLSMTLNVIELQSWQSAWDAGRMVLVLGGLVLMGAVGADPWIAVAVFSGTSTLAYLILYYITRKGLQFRSRQAAAGTV